MDTVLQLITKGGIEHIGSIIGICILFAILAIMNKIKRELVEKVLSLTKNFNDYGHEASVRESISCDRDINIELSRLLFGAKASRVSLFLFHNGSIFSSTNNPIWKISSTHEICEAGVSQEVHKTQDIKASLLTALVSPMFTGINIEGIQKVELNKSQSKRKHIFRITPELIKDSFTKIFLMNRGTKFAIMSPLIDWSSNVIGFVFLEYCHDGFMTEEELNKNADLTDRTTARIYQLISDLDNSIVVQAHQPKKSKWKLLGNKSK